MSNRAVHLEMHEAFRYDVLPKVLAVLVATAGATCDASLDFLRLARLCEEGFVCSQPVQASAWRALSFRIAADFDAYGPCYGNPPEVMRETSHD